MIFLLLADDEEFPKAHPSKVEHQSFTPEDLSPQEFERRKRAELCAGAVLRRKAQAEVTVQMQKEQVLANVRNKVAEWAKGLSEAPNPSEYALHHMFNDPLAPYRDIVFEQIEKDLTEKSAMDSRDYLYLNFLTIQTALFGKDSYNENGNNWHFDEKKRLVVNVWGDGNCFMHVLFEEVPELLIDCGFKIEDIMRYLRRENMLTPEAVNIFINSFREGLAKIIIEKFRSKKITLDTEFKFASEDDLYKVELESYEYPDTMRSLVRLIVGPEHDLSDDNLIAALQTHIETPYNFVDTKLARLIAFLFDLNVIVADIDSVDQKDYINVTVKKPTAVLRLMFGARHYRKWIDLSL